MTELDKSIFNVEVENHELIKVAYDAYLANSRSAHAKTKTRADVRGGGKKPWKQKGTGRARFGSTRNPIWRHGGIAGGRTGNENFEKNLSRSAKHVAIRQALSLKNAEKAVVVKDLKFTGKTKDLATSLKEYADKNILLVVAEKTDENIRSARNIATLKLVRATYLNVFDIMNAGVVIFTTEGLKATTTWLKEDK